MISRIGGNGRPPMILFTYKKKEVYFLGFVHGAPPHYVISEKFKKELDKEIRKADFVLAESFDKKSFEKSIGYGFPEPKKAWVPLDSNREVDELVREVGVEKAVKMLERIRDAPAKVSKKVVEGSTPEETEKKRLLLDALDGDHDALSTLMGQAPVCHDVECIWDNIRNLQWVRKILYTLNSRCKRNKNCRILVLAGVGHTPIMNYLGNPAWFEEQYNRYYGELDSITKNMVRKLQQSLDEKRRIVPKGASDKY